jgi:protoporphyrinogen oxidase
LYATDLATLDKNAMGRFFPHADLTDIVRNMRQANNASYNATFTYPSGGAIEYVKAIQSAVRPGAVRLSEPVTKIDLGRRVATTAQGEYHYQRLVSSAPFPRLLQLCGVEHDPALFTWNKVLVFNLGFDSKGPREAHWIYYPSRALPFYRVGFYDNIFDTERMSLYVELGFSSGTTPDIAAELERVLAGLRAEKVLTNQKLLAHHSVVMNPAYVHITQASLAAHACLTTQLRDSGVFSVGRYGGWTYCSIEDNILEARELVRSWSGKPTLLG